ncbi:MAG: hypothetical protein MJ141_05895 [Clostridia bacterium]|nr:hypothetical protein [Clostridia bacterium]
MRNRSIEFIAILYILIWTISPPMQAGLGYRIAALGCAVILAAANGFKLNREKHGLPLLFVALVGLTAIIIEGELSAAIGQIAVYLLFIGYLMNDWYEGDWEAFRLIIPILLAVLAYWNFRSVAVLATDPNAARAVVRNDETALHYIKMGVGGYGMTYAQVCIAPAIVSWILRSFKKKPLFFAIGVIWAVSYYQYISLAGYSIAVAATVIGLIILLLYRRKETAPALVISLLLVLLLVYLIGYNEPFRNWLFRIFDGTKVAYKIRDITSTIETDETADSIYQRIKRYRASFQAILHYPIVGAWWKGGAGGHSAILDNFAQYGLFGGLMYIKMLYCVPNTMKKADIAQKTIMAINATIVTITFVALLDSMPYNIVMMPTVVLPILLHDIENWSSEHEDLMDR